MEGNLKLILGLIWTLILHYQISIGFGLDDQPKGGPTPKQALLDYINVSYDVPLAVPSVLVLHGPIAIVSVIVMLVVSECRTTSHRC